MSSKNVQVQPFECGLSCAAEVIGRVHSVPLTIDRLRVQHPSLAKGANIGQLRDLLQQYQVFSKAVRAEPSHLCNQYLPAILHWGHNHFVVMLKRTRKGARLFDPAKGEVFVDDSQLDEMFTGVALISCRAVGRLELTGIESSFTPEIFKLAHPHIKWMLMVLLVGQLLAVLMPAQMQWVIDNLSIVGRQTNLYVGLGGFFLLGALLVVANWSRDSLLSGILIDLKERARVVVYDVLNHPLKSNAVDLPSGEIITRVNSLSEIYRISVQGASMALADVLFVAAVLPILFFYSPTLGIVTVVAILTSSILSIVMMRQIRLRANSDISAQSAIHSALANWAVEGWAQRLVYGRSLCITRWQGLCINQASTEHSVQRVSIALRLATQAVRVFEVAAMYWVLTAAYKQGSLSVGMITAIVTWRGMLAMRSDALLRFYQELKMRGLYIERLSAALNCHDSANSRRQSINFDGTLSFRSAEGGVHPSRRRYPDSFEVANGQRVLIYGPSGAGKSYFFKAMMSVTSLDQGAIFYAGYPVESLNPDCVASAIGWVSSDAPMVNGVLLDVLDPARATGTDQILVWLTDLGLYQWFAELPLGFLTLVGPSGISLSQGQQTRLALIRALCKRPSYLLLDEPLAHLDANAVQKVCDLLVRTPITQLWIHHGSLPIAFEQAIRVRPVSRQSSYTDSKGHDAAGDSDARQCGGERWKDKCD